MQVLASEQYTSEVWEQYDAVQSAGVHSIPVFIFDDKWKMHGSKSIEDFVGLIQQIENYYQNN